MLNSLNSMKNIDEAYEILVDKVVEWAKREENIRAVAIIGSRAQLDGSADGWSDMDLLLLTHDPEELISRDEWIHEIGKPWLTYVQITGGGSIYERRVLYGGSLDLDFAGVKVDHYLQAISAATPNVLADVMRSGFRILVDKDGHLTETRTRGIGRMTAILPSEEVFLYLVNDFWYHAWRTAKHLRRGELWWALSGCDSHLKSLLREMLEWHAKAKGVVEPSAWLRGRFLENWADNRAVESLPELFARYQVNDIWRALKAAMDLFRWLARETAASLRFDYPDEAEAQATALVDLLFDEMNGEKWK